MPKPKKVDSIKHKQQTRPNNPTAEMEEILATEENTPQLVQYNRNKDLDPQLYWTGKDEENNSELHIDAVPIYVQEKIHPQAIINDLQRQTAQKRSEQPGGTADMFASDFNGLTDEIDRMEFYQHKQKWTNRLILGDSLMVMASLAHKEGLKGQIQCIYMDPPYGIKFSSNWQTSTKSTEVKDSDETHEPEMIKAFRDTWKDGIHSYLSYLRDRLTVARDLLNESGSFFMQIGDENVHLVATLMDEIFGPENRVATITFATTSGSSARELPQIGDYLLWYAKDKDKVKYSQLYEQMDKKEMVDFFNWDVHLELPDGSVRKLTKEEFSDPVAHIPKGASLVRRSGLYSQGASATGRSKPYTWRNKEYPCAANRHWSVSMEGLDRLAKARRLLAESGQNSLMWKRYEHEVPGKRLNNLWSNKMYPTDKRYVVQTANKVIQRCILMTTDPGDLVLDPTCGSATTATVAEQWGRRWITIDTSRVALAIARARLMGSKYDYYLMQDSEEGAKKEQQLSGKPATKTQYNDDIRHGFVYERVNTVSPKTFADNLEIDEIWDKWQRKLQPLQEELNKILGKNYEEWEIPTEPESDWTKAAVEIHTQWFAAKRQRQQQMDASIATTAHTEYLVDRPYTANNAVRVTGPFTVESLSPHRILPTSEQDEELLDAVAQEAADEAKESNFMQVICDNLMIAGVQNTRKNERLMFSEIAPWVGSQHIQYCGYYEENGKTKKAAICIGPEYGTVTRSQIIAAARAAADLFDVVAMLGFAFEAYADESTMTIGKLEIMRVNLNNDLHMGDRLKKTGNSNLFVVFGEPDIETRKLANSMWEVEIKGVDIFDPTTGETRASDVDKIACWMIDTNYNEQSFFARHIYFNGKGKDPYKQLKRALNSDIDKEAWDSLCKPISRPFPSPETGKIAVKAINHYGDEVIKVFTIPE